MAKKSLAEAVPTKSDKKTTCRISFKTAKEMQDAVGDLELKEELTLTIKGLITSLAMHNEKDWQDASLELEVSTISGDTKAAATNKKELADMASEDE